MPNLAKMKIYFLNSVSHPYALLTLYADSSHSTLCAFPP